MWDYAPDNGESCSGSTQPFGDDALVAVTANSTRIGRTYIKALFVEYTDATFKTKKVFTPNHDMFCHSCASLAGHATCINSCVVPLHRLTCLPGDPMQPTSHDYGWPQEYATALQRRSG